ncbi:MAG: Rnase Y domain-containing protein, partial [Bacteroidota bacterium]
MDSQIIILIAEGLVAMFIGFIVSRYVLARTMKARESAAEAKAQSIIKEAESEAEVIKKNKILEAKERFIQLKAEHEKSIGEKDKNIAAAENRIKQKESQLAQKVEQTQKK